MIAKMRSFENLAGIEIILGQVDSARERCSISYPFDSTMEDESLIFSIDTEVMESSEPMLQFLKKDRSRHTLNSNPLAHKLVYHPNLKYYARHGGSYISMKVHKPFSSITRVMTLKT